MKEKILTILDRFTRQEIGNRLSEFAMMSLRAMILDVIEKEQTKEKDGVSKKDNHPGV